MKQGKIQKGRSEFCSPLTTVDKYRPLCNYLIYLSMTVVETNQRCISSTKINDLNRSICIFYLIQINGK